MIDFVSGAVFVISFCASGASLLNDQTCEDKTISTHLEIKVITADHCDLSDCWKRMNNLLEVRRDGELLVSIPPDLLSSKERELLFQLLIPGAAVPSDLYGPPH